MSCHRQYEAEQKHKLLVLFVLAAAVVLLAVLDLSTGTSGMSLADLEAAVLAGPSAESPEALIFWSLRFPMTATGLFVGAALSLAGLQIQTITANALASPSTLGITSGASFGAALAITSGFSIAGELWLGTMTAAFAASLLISGLIVSLGRMRGMTPSTLILAGIVMNFFFMALEQLLVYLASPEVGQLISGWTFGNLERAGWLSAAVAGGALVFGLALLAPRVWELTTLSIGEERAASLGIRVSRLRLIVFGSASMLIAASVSFIGTIAFVGLVAPHCAKLLLGDDQRSLMPASTLFGALIMLLSSLVSKTISTGAMLPAGIITSIVGVPFLFALLIKNRNEF